MGYMLKSVVSVAVFAAYAAAQAAGQLAFTTLPGSIQAGQSYTLEWAGGDATAPVTIILRQGDPNNLDTVSTITTTATGARTPGRSHLPSSTAPITHSRLSR